jgi:hypothetical protein
MAITNNNKKQVDLPVWEGCNFFPAANSAISEMCCVETPDTRYMYMLVSSLFWRYDTYTDTWLSLAPPVTAPLLILSLKYLPYFSYSGQVIAGGGSTIQGAFLQGNTFVGNKIRIIAGTGIGQERTVLTVADAVIADSGIPTTGGSNTITDTTKKWDINQWTGYTLKIVNFNGQSQFRKILYNTATVLTVSDPLWQPSAPKENMPFVTAATTASIYTIESNVLTVNSAWTVQPNGSSKYRILSGGIAALSTTAAAPFQTFQVYDIASDMWLTRSTQQGLLLAAGAVANDISFARLDEGEVTGSQYDSGTATVTGSSTRALGDTTKTWTVDQWANYEVKITAGTGVGTEKRILGNTASILYVDGLITQPDATSVYYIRPYKELYYASGWALSTMLGYDSDYDIWCQGFPSDGGLANIMSVSTSGSLPIACTATRAVNGIKTIDAAPAAGGTGYVVGDILTCNQTGSGGLLIVTSTDSNGVVTGLKIQKCGTNYGVAGARSTTGGSGNGACTFNVTAVDIIGTITTAFSHNFQAGDSVTFMGADVATSAWNATYTIIGTSGLTTFDVVTTAAGSAVALTAQSSSVIVDASKTWTVNEHVGKIVQLSLTGLTGTSLMRKIASNTATALTLYGSVLGAAAVEGTGRYIIHDQDAFGRAVQDKNPVRTNTGWCTASVSATVLTDSTKTWRGNQWLGYKVKVICGMGFDKGEAVITSNTATTLVVSGGYGFTPDTTTKYIIQDTFGVPTTVTNTTNAVITDTSKLWVVNQWSGFKIRIVGAEGTGEEKVITSNTSTALTITGVFTTAPVANSSVYTILGVPVRGTGHELTWIANGTTNKGKYLISPRGGGTNLFDRYNISTNTYDLTFAPKPDTETFNVGTMYAYDGADRIYIQKDATGKLMYLDLTTYRVEGAGFVPYILGNTGIGTAVNGNRMEIIQTTDGLKYLYIMKHTGAALAAAGGGTEMYKMLIFW